MTRTMAIVLTLGIFGALLALPQDPPKTAPETKQETKKESKTGRRSTVRVQVLGDGQEIAGATVRLKAVDTSYDQEKPSNAHGLATFANAPRGKVTVQVIAASWNSFGDQFQITAADQTISVLLTKP